LISGYDILFFWDSRMIMMGLHLTSGARAEQRIPFRRLYLHSLVRLAGGEKMSKTKGTGVDPLEMTKQYGTDAMRYMLSSMAAPGTDIIMSEDRILAARAFANKIWNAARFLFVNLEKFEATGTTIEELAAPEIREKAPYAVPAGRTRGLADHWIFSRLARVAGEMNAAFSEFRFHEAAQTVYHFFWGDFCDWYIEWIKPQLLSEDRGAAIAAWRNLFAVLDAALRMLHPIMPFITEELWHRLPQAEGERSIALQAFPEPKAAWLDEDAERQMVQLQEIIAAARNIRAELKIDPKKKIAADLSSADGAFVELVRQNLDPILRLASLSALNFSSGRLDSKGGLMRSTAQFDLRIAYGEGVDKQAEINKIKKDTERLGKDIESKRARLADDNFRSKAPAEIIRNLENTLAEREAERQKLGERLAQLQ
jgi:valyl-tRNA synthetase